MKHKFFLLGAVILTSSTSMQPSYAQYISYPGSSETINLGTGQPVNDMGTKNYRPEDHPREADTTPHSETIFLHGDPVGRIDEHGEVFDNRGRSVGVVDPDGGTVLYHGDPVGHVDSGGDIRDNRGRIVASGGSDGNVLIHGDPAGRVDHNGEVYDNAGRDIGKVPAGSNAVGALMLLQNQNK
ncbi:hypothetical protein PT277_08000 [Acetobacteraceae bacterium ESL0709]|nr:hypothetical protein [Acetobacteraceae bacterium ESL0697]MDF7678622.1 hypothetical protein [Acetobacteraceae bacterium ESL0709]